MPLDGCAVQSVVQELTRTLAGGRIDKVTQPEKDELVLAIRSRGQNHRLLLTANAASPRIHFTAQSKTNPDQAPMFCMLLRKHIQGGKILDIIQPDFERIVELHIEAMDELGDYTRKRLLIEIMGRHSNIILTDAAGTVLDAIKHINRETSAVREMLPGRVYVRPPSQGKVPPFPVDTAYLHTVFAEKKDLRAQEVLFKAYNGISQVLASELCERAGIAAETFAGALDEAALTRLRDVFAALEETIRSGRFENTVYYDEKGEKDFSAIPLGLYESLRKKVFPSPSEMLESYYIRRDAAYRVSQKTADLRRLIAGHIERCVKKQQVYENTERAIADREQLRRYGELITAYIYAVPSGASSVTVPDFYNDGAENAEITIPLDPSLGPAVNAQLYFKRYNKAKRTAAALAGRMEANQDDLAYLDTVLASMERVADETDIAEIRSELAGQGFLKKKHLQVQAKGRKAAKLKKSVPLHYQSAEGFDIFVGKNNTQNDELTLKTARADDIWLHTKDIAGSHVIIKAEGRPVPDGTLLTAARLAAYHSKARQSGQVPVDYAARRHVKKPSGAKPGFVIYDNHRTVYVTPGEAPDAAIKEASP